MDYKNHSGISLKSTCPDDGGKKTPETSVNICPTTRCYIRLHRRTYILFCVISNTEAYIRLLKQIHMLHCEPYAQADAIELRFAQTRPFHLSSTFGS